MWGGELEDIGHVGCTFLLFDHREKLVICREVLVPFSREQKLGRLEVLEGEAEMWQ